MKIQLKGCLNVHLHCCILSFAEVPSVYIFIHAIGSMRSLNYTSPRSPFLIYRPWPNKSLFTCLISYLILNNEILGAAESAGN